jgi:hypothetical protein
MPTWVTSLFSSIVNLPSAIAAAFNAWMQRDKEENTQPMQDSAQAVQDEADSERITQDINAAHAGKPEALESDEA